MEKKKSRPRTEEKDPANPFWADEKRGGREIERGTSRAEPAPIYSYKMKLEMYEIQSSKR